MLTVNLFVKVIYDRGLHITYAVQETLLMPQKKESVTKEEGKMLTNVGAGSQCKKKILNVNIVTAA